MARGWESKSVEAQQEEKARGAAPAPPLTPEQQQRAERRRSLELARRKAAEDLNRAGNPAHRTMLEQAIAALDAQLGELGGVEIRRR